MQGISLGLNDLSGWDFHEQNLSGAEFSRANLANSNLAGANLMNARLAHDGYPGNEAVIAGANLTSADIRGAQIVGLAFATTRNAILPDGGIMGLELLAGERLLVRDDDGLPAALPNGIQTRAPIPVAIQDRALFAEGGFLQLLFDADEWDSLISFEPGINVELDGALQLSFADDIDVATQIGRTLKLFDWRGVSPGGQFDVQSPYFWDTTKLYTTGEVTLLALSVPIAGDYNHDGIVDAADYIVWRKGLGTIYTQNDHDAWRANFGKTVGSGASLPSAVPLPANVPEPSTASVLLTVNLTFAACWRLTRLRLRPSKKT